VDLDQLEFKMNREQKRRKKKLKIKEEPKVQEDTQVNEINEKLSLFEKIPNICNTCLIDFDKTNKQQVKTWCVVVRNDTEQVRLYCPDCWSKAQAVVQAYEKEQGNGRDQE
jgi:hypothetical protein